MNREELVLCLEVFKLARQLVFESKKRLKNGKHTPKNRLLRKESRDRFSNCAECRVTGFENGLKINEMHGFQAYFESNSVSKVYFHAICAANRVKIYNICICVFVSFYLSLCLTTCL